MPRVGNKEFANWTQTLFPTQYLRIVNQNDLTPHLPPLISQFEHAGREFWIQNNEGETIECFETEQENSLESSECSNQVSFWDITKHGYAWKYPIGHRSCF
jgi:hypothetical protein